MNNHRSSVVLNLLISIALIVPPLSASANTSPVAITTNPATGITTTDATLNGTVNVAAVGHSFWVSTSTPIDTSSASIPTGVYSTPDFGAIATGTSFSATLSSLLSSAVPGVMPSITPNTPYYFVAWANVGGTWYPGSQLNFTTGSLNTPPVAVADSYNVAHDTTLTVAAGNGVLANDTDAQHDALTAVLDTTVAHGTLALNGDGSFTYTPTANYAGTDSFTYHANDGTSNSTTATTTITVTPSTASNTIVVRQSDLDTSSSSPAVVVADGLNKWFMYNDSNDTVDNTIGSFVTGPASAPIGIGSIEFTLAASPQDRKDIATYQYQGVALSKITSLMFSAYSHSGVAGANESPYLVFNVDFNGSNTWQKRLAYVPSNNGAVPQNTWNSFDAINGGAAQWVYSGATWPVTAVGPDATQTGIPGTTARTWASILADYPNARILPTGGLLGVRVGEPGPADYVGDVDNIVVGVQSGATITTNTYDFDPAAPLSGGSGPLSISSGSSISSGTSGNTTSTSTTPVGQVLGVSTSTVNTQAGTSTATTTPPVVGPSCSALLATYMGVHHSNDVAEVKKLQAFLNVTLGMHIPITGSFGPMTLAGVNAFQTKYTAQTLTPWGLTAPTGYVYKSTQRWINLTYCPTLNIPMPILN